MHTSISRRKIAQVVARRIARGDSQETILRDVAGYLVETGRQKEAELLVRDIEHQLVQHGVVVGDVTVSEKSALDYEAMIKQLRPAAKKVFVREHLDPAVLGGIKIELPGERYDATVRKKIDSIRQLTT